MKFFPLPALLTTPTRIMLLVWLAAIPALATITHYFGYGPLIHVVIASVFALILEAGVLYLRRQPIIPRLTDGSVLITALLFAIGLPPGLSVGLVFIGIFFAVVIAKHLYGGLGHNIFNPAMVGYAILLVAFPQQMTQWSITVINGLEISFFATLKIIFLGAQSLPVDAITQATPLDTLKTLQRTATDLKPFFSQPLFQDPLTQKWAWVNVAWLSGGIILLLFRVISSAIVCGFLLSFTLMACCFYFLAPATHAPPLFHLFTGATMMGAFFIATDPVTACNTLTGKWIFGAGIGALTYLLRTQTHYPEGIAFAVLLMNILVPLLDQLVTKTVRTST